LVVQPKLSQHPDARFVVKWKRRFSRVLTDSRWTRFYLQSLVRDPNHRRLLASVVAKWLPKTPLPKGPGDEVRSLVRNMQDQGYATLDGIFTKEKASEIRAYFANRQCYDPCRPEIKGFTDPNLAERACLHAYFPAAEVAAAPHILELANHPLVLGAVEAIFGAKPIISNIFVWWLLHGFDHQANTHDTYACRPHEFHRDMDDLAAVKLYVYLTDVDETSGPHAVIRGSHRWSLPKRQRSLQLSDPAYPSKENLHLIMGPAGFAWLENSFTLHRAIIATGKHRLIIAITYTLLPVAFGPNEPFLPKDGRKLDPYTNQVFIQA